MSTAPVALILGAGANVGQNVARAFLAKGYKTVLASRSLKEEDSTSSQINIRSDFSDPESVAQVFSKVQSTLGHPHVVVYNGMPHATPPRQCIITNSFLAAAAVTPGDAKDPLALDLDKFSRDLAINTTSAFAAAQQAAGAFAKLPETASRTFIYTGNITNVTAFPALLDLGVGKSATAHIVECAAEGYKEKGFK